MRSEVKTVDIFRSVTTAGIVKLFKREGFMFTKKEEGRIYMEQVWDRI